jgi:hypothetical protein
MEVEHRGYESGVIQDGSEKVMEEEPLIPGDQSYHLCGGIARIRNTAREKTESHNVRRANTHS